MGRRHRTDHNHRWRWQQNRDDWGAQLHGWVVNGSGDDDRRMENHRLAEADVDRNGSPSGGGDGGGCQCDSEEQFRFHARFDCGPAETFDRRASEKLEAVLTGEDGGRSAGVPTAMTRLTGRVWPPALPGVSGWMKPTDGGQDEARIPTLNPTGTL